MPEKNCNPYQNIANDLEALQNGASAPPPPPPAIHINSNHIAPLPSYPTIINSNPSVGPNSTELNCPQCRCRIRTKVSHRSTSKTHIACLLLSWTLCCCCLPYCMDSCRNANHFCPMCGAFIGTYQS